MVQSSFFNLKAVLRAPRGAWVSVENFLRSFSCCWLKSLESQLVLPKNVLSVSFLDLLFEAIGLMMKRYSPFLPINRIGKSECFSTPETFCSMSLPSSLLPSSSDVRIFITSFMMSSPRELFLFTLLPSDFPFFLNFWLCWDDDVCLMLVLTSLWVALVKMSLFQVPLSLNDEESERSTTSIAPSKSKTARFENIFNWRHNWLIAFNAPKAKFKICSTQSLAEISHPANCLDQFHVLSLKWANLDNKIVSFWLEWPAVLRWQRCRSSLNPWRGYILKGKI